MFVHVILLTKKVLEGSASPDLKTNDRDYPTDCTRAPWNYLFVEDDKGEGFHNPAFPKALLDLVLINLSK